MRYAVLVLASALLLAGSAAASGVVQPPVPDGVTTVEVPAVTSTEGTVTTTVPVPAPQPATVPADQAVPTAPTVLPVPGHQLQTLLIKQVRRRIVLYTKSAHHWQSLLGRQLSPVGNIWKLGSLQNANKLLGTWQKRSHSLHIYAKRWMEQKIAFYQRQIQYWSAVMGARPPRSSRALASSGSIEFRFNRTGRQYRQVMAQAKNPPHLGDFMCIHSHEGSWTDEGAPYYGGIQFGYSEWMTYGYPFTHKQYAYEASPLEQIWAGERYYRVSGFGPWPQTARMCGLL